MIFSLNIGLVSIESDFTAIIMPKKTVTPPKNTMKNTEIGKQYLLKH